MNGSIAAPGMATGRRRTALTATGARPAGGTVAPSSPSWFRRPGDTAWPAASEAGKFARLPEGSYLIPGLVDSQVHAPQYPQLGQALDVPLKTWLYTYTFPFEARCSDIVFARAVYSLLVDDLISIGTTTALYYAMDHRERCPDNAEGRVLAVVSPRFIPSCTDVSLKGLGAMSLARSCTFRQDVCRGASSGMKRAIYGGNKSFQEIA